MSLVTSSGILAKFQRPERSRTTLSFVLSGLFMLIKAVNNLLYLSVLTSFLEKAGAVNLPWVYLAVNAGFIFIQFQFISRIAGNEGHWLLSKISIPMILTSFIAAFVLPVESTVVLLLFLVAAMLTDLTSNQAFTAMLNHFLNLNEAKKILPFVYASGSLGYILSGLLLKFVIDLAGFHGLLVLNGVIAIIAAGLVSMLKPYEDDRKEKSVDVESQQGTEQGEEIESSFKHPLARLLICSSFLVLFNRYLIDFLFAAAVTSYFSSGKALASFMGIFGASADLIVIGLQTFVMKAVFSSISLGRVLTFVPAILIFLCLAASYSMEFAVIATVQFLVMINSKNFTVPATTMLMGAIPQKNRVYYRRDLSITCSIASTCVGGFLLLARNNISPASLFFIAAVLYLALATVHFLLDKAYLVTLRRYIMNPSGKAEEEQISSLRYLQQKDRLEQLEILLASESIDTRVLAIREMNELTPVEVENFLKAYLSKETNAKCLTEGARVLVRVCGQSAIGSIVELINSTLDQRLRADLIEELGKMRGIEEVEEISFAHIEHFHHRVKASAIISLLRVTRDPFKLKISLKELAQMASNSAELMRSSAAAVMGELGLPLFLPCLEGLAFEDNSSVAITAINAISRIQTPAAIASLDTLKSHSNPEISTMAHELSSAAAKNSYEQIGRLLSTISAEERLQLASRMKKMRTDNSYELLAVILCVEDVNVRKRLIQILEKADEETAGLISRCLVSTRENTVVFNLAPAFSMALNDFYLDLPSWAEVVNAIGSGSFEGSEQANGYVESAKHFIAGIWAEKAVAAKLNLSQMRAEKLQKRTLVACQLFCCLSKDPVSLLKSLESACVGSDYIRSMAVEYIETRIGQKFSSFVIPVLQELETGEDNSQALLEKADALGLGISSAAMTAAKGRLTENFEMKSNEESI